MKKMCNKCKEEKELSEFNKDKYSKDGYTTICKYCRSHRYKLECQICGVSFKGSHKTQKFCSNECKHEYLTGENNGSYKNALIETTCYQCGKTFKKFKSAKKSERDFCSKECSQKYFVGENHMNFKNAIVSFKCDYCGAESSTKKSQYDKTEKHYCSVECMGKHKSIINIGKNNPNYKHGNVRFNCDYCGIECEVTKSQYDKSERHFCSIKCSALYYSPFRSGENAWNWNPNLSEEDRILARDYKEYNHWRMSVFERDNYTCQCCGQVGGDLEAHHKNGYDNFEDERLNINNGVTLCKNNCHKDFHIAYGYGGNTKEQYEEWIKNKMKDKSA